MKKLLIIVGLVISGCMHVPVAVNVLEPPEELLKQCNDLSLIDANEKKLSNIIDVIVSNYSKYHECRVKVEKWIELHQKQKEILERFNENVNDD